MACSTCSLLRESSDESPEKFFMSRDPFIGELQLQKFFCLGITFISGNLLTISSDTRSSIRKERATAPALQG